MANRFAIIGVVTFLLAGCAGVQSTTLQMASYRVSGELPSAPAHLKVAIDTPSDMRAGGWPSVRIGERKTVGDLSMGDVETSPGPAKLIQDVLSTELQSAGHSIVADNSDLRISTEMQRFELWTDPTMLYWDVNAAIDIAVGISNKEKTQSSKYAVTCSQRTYIWPSSELMRDVVNDCLQQIGKKFRTDPAVQQVFASASHN